MDINIYIGTEERQYVSTEVLKHSIIRRTKEKVIFNELKNLVTNLKQKMYTGFSFYRFAIPTMNQFKTKAIYIDTDVFFLEDVAKLYETDSIQPVLARKKSENSYYTSVMLMDCPRLTHWDFAKLVREANKSRIVYNEIMWATKGSIIAKDVGQLDPRWNCLDNWNLDTKAIHFTNVPTQPWTYDRHPYGKIFLRELRSAIDTGFLNADKVKENLKFLYPTILKDCYANHS